MIRTNKDSILSQVITALRFPLIVLVLFVHSNFKGVRKFNIELQSQVLV